MGIISAAGISARGRRKIYRGGAKVGRQRSNIQAF
jgi:hypothetical protein